MEKFAYYGCFFIQDLVFTYIPVTLTWLLTRYFNLRYYNSEYTFMLYPLALIPYTYASSFIFAKESTA